MEDFFFISDLLWYEHMYYILIVNFHCSQLDFISNLDAGRDRKGEDDRQSQTYVHNAVISPGPTRIARASPSVLSHPIDELSVV